MFNFLTLMWFLALCLSLFPFGSIGETEVQQRLDLFSRFIEGFGELLDGFLVVLHMFDEGRIILTRV